jgi:ankyrin repeat protein
MPNKFLAKRHNRGDAESMNGILSLILFLFTVPLWSDVLMGMEDDLLRASARNNYRMVEILLKEGTDIHCREPKSGFTPLHIGARNGHYGIVEILLQYGANPNKKDIEYGFSPLLVATFHGNHSIAKLLLDKGANPNEQESKSGNTALHIASQKGYLDIVKLLIDRKADHSIKNSRGKNFLDKAHPIVRDYFKGITIANSSKSISEGCRALILDLNEVGFSSEEMSRKGQGIFFERIYLAYNNQANFLNCLNYFLDNDSEKYYWISLFLFDEEYTNLRYFSLARDVLQKGIEQGEDKSIAVSMNFIYGLSYWRENNRKDAKPYFEKAYELSTKFPGTIPALSLDEKVEIDKFMGFTE